MQNWYAVIPGWRSLQLVVVAPAGHGAQHQEPRFCADLIASFVANVD